MGLFQEFPKMARLSREVIITEKLDGTNAAVIVSPIEDEDYLIAKVDDLCLYAQSKSRVITVEDDNFGFAKWVKENAPELVKLGVGRHFGEWWGKGIQRGYGLSERRFSLFNAIRWVPSWKEPEEMVSLDPRPEEARMQEKAPSCCHVVPVLNRNVFNTNIIEDVLEYLRQEGSVAVPGYMKPEGIVVYHVAGNVGFKKTLESDKPKSLKKKSKE